MTKTDSAYPILYMHDSAHPRTEKNYIGDGNYEFINHSGITIHQKLAMELFVKSVNSHSGGKQVILYAEAAIKAADIFFEQYNKPKAEGEK